MPTTFNLILTAVTFVVIASLIAQVLTPISICIPVSLGCILICAIKSREEPLQTTPCSVKGCRDLIACKGLWSGQTFVLNTLSNLESRAGPNGRLARVFGIDNSFTTVDRGRHQEFKSVAWSRLQLSPARWRELGAYAREIARSEIVSAKHNFAELKLVPFIQQLTMKIALQVMFDATPPESQKENVALVAQEINRLWTVSKSGDLDSVEPFEEQSTLGKALLELVPNCSFNPPSSNPLNLIVPAYDSIWRIALLGAVECLRARPSAGSNTNLEQQPAPVYRAPLVRFLEDPAISQDNKDTCGITAFDIGRETLRLYPSSRRVYRDFQLSGGRSGDRISCAANVAACHNDVTLWGWKKPSAGENESDNDDVGLSFRPERWSRQGRPAPSSSGKQHQDRHKQQLEVAFMSFGVPPFVCPAKRDFGVRVIALLIAAICDGVWGSNRVDGDHEVGFSSLHFKPRSIGSFEKTVPLPAGREDSKEWCISY